jgi:hypothetical protein
MSNEKELDAVKLWKEHKVDSATFEFSCGGDSMNETTLFLYDNKGVEIKKDTGELNRLLEDLVYDNVEFYEASDGHYQGEVGTVEITLDDDDETLSFSKNSTSEYSESFTEEGYFELTKEEAVFLKEYASSIFYDDFGGKGEIRYKKDLVMTKERSELIEKFLENLHEFAEDLEIEEATGEPQEYLQYYTGNDIAEDDSVQITKENKLVITVARQYTVYSDSDLI